MEKIYISHRSFFDGMKNFKGSYTVALTKLNDVSILTDYKHYFKLKKLLKERGIDTNIIVRPLCILKIREWIYRLLLTDLMINKEVIYCDVPPHNKKLRSLSNNCKNLKLYSSSSLVKHSRGCV